MNQLYTTWGESVDPLHVLPEYPRPLLYRPGFLLLNGTWEYAIRPDPGKAWDSLEFPSSFDGKILVPFSPESALSGVRRQLQPGQLLWYRRTLASPLPEAPDKRVLLHFGAVDQSCAVYLNGRLAGTHQGGYLPFTLDLTEYLQARENTLLVAVKDASEQSFHSRGKQRLQRGGMYYTAQSGIWQTVWLETVSANSISGVDIDPDADSGRIRLQAHSPQDTPLRLQILSPGIYREKEFDYSSAYAASPSGKIAEASGLTNREITLQLSDLRLWTPEEPYLYYYIAETDDDKVIGYFAFRTVGVERDDQGIPRLALNHRSTFFAGVLDQGYWPDGLYTAPAEEALLFDLGEMRRSGFNMVRKHAKIEPERWYYHCDRLGLAVWQDIVNGGEKYHDFFLTVLSTFLSWIRFPISDRHHWLFSREDPQGRREFEAEMRQTVTLLKSHPCITAWVLFNEGWGQFDTRRLTEEMKKIDPSRPVDSASGWYDQKCGDIISAHFYYLTLRLRHEKKRAFALSEFGGYACHLPGRSSFDEIYGYRKYDSLKALNDDVRQLVCRILALQEKGLCAYVYTQWTDVEEETNGIYTYDRRKKKLTIPFR